MWCRKEEEEEEEECYKFQEKIPFTLRYPVLSNFLMKESTRIFTLSSPYGAERRRDEEEEEECYKLHEEKIPCILRFHVLSNSSPHIVQRRRKKRYVMGFRKEKNP